jgi:hypothetical protein
MISDEPRQLGAAEIPPLRAAAAVVMAYLEEYICSSTPRMPGASMAMPSSAAVLARFSAQLEVEVSRPGVAALVDAVEVGPPPIERLVVKCLGWSGVPITAERLVAALRDSCLHLEAPPVSIDLASPSPIDILPRPTTTSRWSFDAQTTARGGTSSILVIISIWTAAVDTHDIYARRVRGDMRKYHQFLRDLQAELYKRLPEVPQGALVQLGTNNNNDTVDPCVFEAEEPADVGSCGSHTVGLRLPPRSLPAPSASHRREARQDSWGVGRD